ncbi:MAG: UTP--glucose-1-phosphate uridylyltransferase [Chlamydiia bacterium]|nr:UTP--glucose-1-phosphate uridylyltransferase [Chlamydiia bacterium]
MSIEIENQLSGCCPFFADLSSRQQEMLLALIAIGQAHVLDSKGATSAKERLGRLLDQLALVDDFYAPIGGLVGYHRYMHELLAIGNSPVNASYDPPEGIDLTCELSKVNAAILHAIRHWGDFAEIYPVGGAADRLKLQDHVSHVHLPAARLSFAGKPLLAGMMRDLEAREYLHYKLFGVQLVTPVVMMTSPEKDNTEHIRAICEENAWFGRPESSIHLITQPLVPAFDKEGKWCLSEPLTLLLKPGGHGAIWNLMLCTQTFEWLASHKRKVAFLRQINNPIASIDNGALAFLGIGHQKKSNFGFSSCNRLVGTREGVNVLQTKPDGTKCLTNVEYCDFPRHGIEDVACDKKPPFSKFPSNTNILFADLEAAKIAAKKFPFPGMLLNFCPQGNKEVARIEAMMQNLADAFSADSTYITFNHRHKTISTTKRKFDQNDSWVETPEGCFYDLLKNAHDLLTGCHFTVPPLCEKQFFESSPPFIFLYHPALGPLYSIIQQKLRGGRMHEGAELVLEIADVDIENLELSGSLLIETDAITGHLEDGLRVFSNRTGRCRLKNVKVENKGYNRGSGQPFWKHSLSRDEALHIHVSAGGEFVAENVTLSGAQSIYVPENTRLIATSTGFIEEPLSCDRPFWRYSADSDAQIHLEHLG